MKNSFLTFSAALLLTGCNQTAPVTENPAGPAAAVPPSTARADSAMGATIAPPPDAAATANAATAPLFTDVATLKMVFRFQPAPDPDHLGRARTNVHLLLQGTKPRAIDLGNFAGKPDMVDEIKARQAGFPSGMVLGFRSYEAATGTSHDLAVLSVPGNRLRIMQRQVAESAEPGQFKIAREIPLPENTTVVASPSPKPPQSR